MSSRDELPTAVKRLRNYMRWAVIFEIITFTSTTLLALIPSVRGATPPLVIWANEIALFTMLVAFSYGYWATGRNKVMPAIRVVLMALFFIAVLYAVLQPRSAVVLMMIPVLCVSIALPHVSTNSIRILMRWCLALGVVIVFFGYIVRVVKTTEVFAERATNAAIAVALLGLVFYLLVQFHENLTESLRATRKAQREAEDARTDLEQQVARRTAELQKTLGTLEERTTAQATLLKEIALQRETIRELSVPVLPVTNDVIVMPLVGTLDGERLQDVQQRALEELERNHARYLLLDITGVPVVDTHVAQGLLQVVGAGRLLGANVALIGIRPEVAQAVVSLGLNLDQVATYRDLQTALKDINRR